MGRKHLIEEEGIVSPSVRAITEIQEKKRKKKKRKNEMFVEDATLPESNGHSISENGTSKKKKEEKNRSGESELINKEELGFATTGVSVSGKNSSDSKYAALKTFADSGLPSNVLECCKKFSEPSPIQANGWPFLLEGRDFIGIAATGSGKILFKFLRFF